MCSRSNLRDNPNNTTLELQRDLAQCTPEQCVTLTHSVPSVQMYYALRSKLENCTDRWLGEFMHLNGLDSLLNSLDQMSGRGFTCFTDAILQMDCISCIRCILNTSLGMEYFINSDVYIKKLTMVLNSSDVLPKKQVFEILSAVCVYSNIGYLRVMEALSYVKSECDQLHRFSLVLNDLQKSETVAHKTAIMTFVNTIIICTPDITERLRIRNEFIGLNLLDVLMFLRREEPDENLIHQLEIFHERKVADEDSINGSQNIDYNSPQDLLDEIQARVFGTSRMVNFVNVLQDLLAIETVYGKNNIKIWQTVDKVIHHLVHLTSTDTLDTMQTELQRLPEQITQVLHSVQDYQAVSQPAGCEREVCANQQIQECSQTSKVIRTTTNIENRCNIPTGQSVLSKMSSNIVNQSKQSADLTYIDSSSVSNSGTRTFQDSVSSVGNGTVLVKPKLISPACDITYFVNDMDSTASDMHHDSNHSSFNGIRMMSGKQELSDEENNSSNYNSSANKTSRYDQEKVCNEMNILCSSEKSKLMCKDLDESLKKSVKSTNLVPRPQIPAPSGEMRELKWITIPDRCLVDRGSCVWLCPLAKNQQVHINYDKLESLFQVNSPCNFEAIEEVVLLDAETRLKINLFLNRLDSGAEDLVQNLHEGNKKQLTLPMLQYLNSIIPSSQEIVMLQQYERPRLELGMAEQFVLLLAEIPDYQLLLQAFLVQAEFDSCALKFKMSLSAMIKLAKLILNSVDLRILLHAILLVGNYLNHHKFNGDVAGFHLSTLRRLSEVKSTSPCKNLLHFIVQIVIEERPSVLTFVKEVISLENTTSCSMEDLKTDISKLNGKLRFVMTKLSKTEERMRSMFQPFIESIRKDFSIIQSSTTELRTLTDQLANYFCEDGTSFDLQECFYNLQSFCKEVKQCHTETAFLSRQHLVGKRRGDMLHNKLKTKMLSLEFGKNAGASSSMMEEKAKLVDKVLNQLHSGNFQPHAKSEIQTPEKDVRHALEMSCIPFDGSPPVLPRSRLGTMTSDSVFFETPELVCASYGSTEGPKKLTRTSTQEIQPVKTICTAQTRQMEHTNKNLTTSSPVTSGTTQDKNGQPSVTLQRKLFAGEPAVKDTNGEGDCRIEGKQRQRLELPTRKTGHRRSRSDLLDSAGAPSKWIQYENIRTADTDNIGRAPVAVPESTCNLSTLHLENRGKLLTKRDIAAYQSQDELDDDKCSKVKNGPQVKLPHYQVRPSEKKSSVGGFFSKIGRAVLKPRNTYSDGDQPGRVSKEHRKKSTTVEKENLKCDNRTISSEKLSGGEFQRGVDGNTNRLSRFFQRGGLYRSSKMKKKSQKNTS